MSTIAIGELAGTLGLIIDAVNVPFPMSKVNEAMDHSRSGKARYRIVLDADF